MGSSEFDFSQTGKIGASPIATRLEIRFVQGPDLDSIMFEQMLKLVLLGLDCWVNLRVTVNNTVSVLTSLRSWPGLHFSLLHWRCMSYREAAQHGVHKRQRRCGFTSMYTLVLLGFALSFGDIALAARARRWIL